MEKQEIFNELYLLINQWIAMKPWEYIWSDDTVMVEFSQDEIYYCTIMGKLGNCIGLSIYANDEGYADLCSISREYEDPSVAAYMMYEQNCLTFYLGDREEVPDAQRKMIKELGLKYRGRGRWPYFLSFQRRFYPYQINDEEASVFVKVLREMIKIMEEYIAGHIDVQYDDDEIIYAHQDKDTWIYEAICRPESIGKSFGLEIRDEDMIDHFRRLPSTSHEYIIDLAYLNQGMWDDHYDRPINGLALLILDVESQMIVKMDLLQPEVDEIRACMNMFWHVIEDVGKPQSVYIRNPTVLGAIKDFCDQCDIDYYITPLDMVDDLLEEMVNFL